MEKFKKYDKYQSTDIDWIGEIPKSWKLLRLGSVFNERRIKVSDKDYPALSVTKNGVVPQLETAAKTNDGDNRRGVLKGDFVINSRSDRKGSSGLAYLDGSVSLINIVIRPVKIVPKFSEYLLKSRTFIEEFYRNGHGIVDDLWTTRYSDMKGIAIGLPTKEEQKSITSFLDDKTKQIDNYIQLKEKAIALLQERKAAIINQAVTKGLNPNAQMKDSGIEWLDDVPEKWEITTVKKLADLGYKKFTDGDWIESPYITNKGVRLIQTGNVGIGIYKEKGFRYVSDKTFTNLNCTEIIPNDVLICRLDGPVGRACLVPELGVRMITSVDNAILKVNKNVMAEYVVYLMSSNLWLDWIQSLCRAGGGFRFRISRSNLGYLKIPLPPLKEQKNISSYLSEKTNKINQNILQNKKEITLVKEYRESLISAAVTGKIDVRNYKKTATKYATATNL